MPTVTKKSKPKKVSKPNLTAQVFNSEGKKVGRISLPKEIFAVNVKPTLFAQAVRVTLMNRRQGNRTVKTRSQTTGSTRKIYRQKGTGRARHGDIKAPIFIGGGVAHGPKITDFTRKLSKKMKARALFGALTSQYQREKLKIINDLSKFPAKTKNMVRLLKDLELIEKRKNKIPSTLLVTEKVLNNVILSSRNLPYVSTTPVEQLNTYQVLQNENLVFTKSAIEVLQKRIGTNVRSALKGNP